MTTDNAWNRYLGRARVRISTFLDRFLAENAGAATAAGPWGRDLTGRLAEFVGRGKLVRGGLVFLGWESTGHRTSTATARAAGAVELAQSALLVHDDIMDRDRLRRGKPSVHRQYALLAGRRHVSDPERFGQGMGICAGDIAFFLAFEVLAGLRVRSDRLAASIRYLSREFVLVGLGQMQDFHAGLSSWALNEGAILELYRLKTARYSFSVPLSLGCLLAGGSGRLRARLEAYGEALGLLFQLKDDELGLFGDEEKLGKPVGSDLRQGKQTLLHLLLTGRATAAERRWLASAWGNPAATDRDIDRARALAERYGIRDEIRIRLDRYAASAGKAIRLLPLDQARRRVFEGLLEYSLTRRK